MLRSWGREIGEMLQGIGTARRSFWRSPWLERGCCANDDDDDDDDDLYSFVYLLAFCQLYSVKNDKLTVCDKFGRLMTQAVVAYYTTLR